MKKYQVQQCGNCSLLTPAGNHCIECGQAITHLQKEYDFKTCKECEERTPIHSKYCVVCGSTQ